MAEKEGIGKLKSRRKMRAGREEDGKENNLIELSLGPVSQHQPFRQNLVKGLNIKQKHRVKWKSPIALNT